MTRRIVIVNVALAAVLTVSVAWAQQILINAAGANGWIDLRTVALETLTGIRRAGADIVVTYWAADAAAWLA